MRIRLFAGVPVAANSTLTASPDSITADNTASSSLLLTLRDAHNNLVSGQAVSFTSSLNGSHFTTVKDNTDGTYTASLSGTFAGSATVSVMLGSSRSGWCGQCANGCGW